MILKPAEVGSQTGILAGAQRPGEQIPPPGPPFDLYATDRRPPCKSTTETDQNQTHRTLVHGRVPYKLSCQAPAKAQGDA